MMMMRRIAMSTLERRRVVLPQNGLSTTRLRSVAQGRFLSSEQQQQQQQDVQDDSVKKELTEKEQQENARWAIGFFGVILFANFFTIWQEWDALTGNKKKDDGGGGLLVSNGVETIDLYSDDTQKPRTAKYSF
jgi:hypothetical protein